MKTFKYTIEGREVSIRIDEKNATIADILIDGKHPAVQESEIPIYAAVISLALLEYDVEVVHDEEPGHITLQSTANEWGNPVTLQNRFGTTAL